MGTINKAIALVRNPVGFMTSDKDAPATVGSIMINYVAVLAAIPFFATLIGYLWYYSLVGGYAGIFIGFAFVWAVLTYILDVVAVYVIGFVIQMLASNFGTARDQVKSLKLSAYVFTPVFLISVLNIIPPAGSPNDPWTHLRALHTLHGSSNRPGNREGQGRAIPRHNRSGDPDRLLRDSRDHRGCDGDNLRDDVRLSLELRTAH
jgi:uncharacterized membrane protein